MSESGPWIRRSWKVSARALAIFFEIEGGRRAASFAYYALFSLVPLFALLLTIGSAFVHPDEVISSVERFFPMEPAQQEMVWKMTDSLQRARGGIGLAALLVLVWGSMRFFQTLVQGVNRAWHRTSMPWWKLSLKNLLMMAVLASAMGIGLVAPAILQGSMHAATAFEDFLSQALPGLHFGVFSLAMSGGRYLVAGGLMFYALTALYMLSPGRRIRFREVWIPALAVTAALQLGQSLFTAYAARFIDYNAIYGPVGAIMLALLWIHIAGAAILLGGCLCAAASEEKSGPAIPSSP
jgi:membrane protein